MKNSQKGFAVPIIIAVVALLALGGGYVYLKNTKIGPGLPQDNFDWSNVQRPAISTSTGVVDTTTNAALPVGCTKDAKQCPDGSYIGRSGPNCEFMCPIVTKVYIKAYPPAGSACVLGSVCNIFWKSSGLSSSNKVSVLLINKSINYYNTLNTNQSVLLGAEFYSWTIPSTEAVGDQYQIRICALDSSGSAFNMPCNDSINFAIWPVAQ